MSALYNQIFGRNITWKNVINVTVPPKEDARYALLIFQTVYVYYILLSPEFVRSYQQYMISVASCLIFDLFFQLLFYKKISVFPLSSFITGHGTFLLLYSPELWPYVFVAFVSVLLKFSVRWKGVHVFNPNNVGIVLAVLLFDKSISLTPGAWQGHNVILGIIILLGLYVTVVARRTVMVMSFLTSFIFYGLIYSKVHAPFNFWFYIYPMTGVAFQIYLFYMITDPITTPSPKLLQVAAGFSLASFDFFFRLHEEKYSLIFASTCTVLLFLTIKIMTHYFKRETVECS